MTQRANSGQTLVPKPPSRYCCRYFPVEGRSDFASAAECFAAAAVAPAGWTGYPAVVTEAEDFAAAKEFWLPRLLADFETGRDCWHSTPSIGPTAAIFNII